MREGVTLSPTRETRALPRTLQAAIHPHFFNTKNRVTFLSDCDWRFNGRVWIVIEQLEIFETKVANILDLRVQLHPRERAALASELFARLFEVIRVEMQVAEGVNEIARPEIANLRHHHRQERIARNVERDSEK